MMTASPGDVPVCHIFGASMNWVSLDTSRSENSPVHIQAHGSVPWMEAVKYRG